MNRDQKENKYSSLQQLIFTEGGENKYRNGIGNGENEKIFLAFEIAGCIVPLYDAARPSINPTVVLSCSYKV